MKKGKECYRRKLETKLGLNNLRCRMRTITADQVMKTDLQEANEIDLSFNRCDDVVSAQPPPCSCLAYTHTPYLPHPNSPSLAATPHYLSATTPRLSLSHQDPLTDSVSLHHGGHDKGIKSPMPREGCGTCLAPWSFFSTSLT